MSQYEALYGPPGTGKTFTNINTMREHLATQTGNVLYCSHTRAAAQEAISRWPVDQPARIDLQTLHALCFRALKLSKAQTVDFAKLDAFGKEFGIDMSNDEGVEALGPKYIEVMSFGRARRMTVEQAYEASMRPGTYPHFLAFAESYTQWKKAYGYMDFDDMLVSFTLREPRVPGYSLVVIDEAQDLTPLQWAVVDCLLEQLPKARTIIAGDDDQCQPAGTQVWTQSGHVKIEDLDPKVHKVWSGGQKSYGWQPFKKASRSYKGTLIEIECGGWTSRYTPNHKCMARFNASPEQVARGRVVYLMQKGNSFRVGETKAFIQNRFGAMFYPKARLRQEGGDQLWVLDYTESPEESRILESLYAVEFGLPTTIFDYTGLRLKQGIGPQLHRRIEARVDLRERAQRLLESKGMSIDHPFWVKKVGGQRTFQVYAMNLLPGLMTMALLPGDPSARGRPPEWLPFTVNRVNYTGRVYSLDVAGQSQTYFADHILTHNSIFVWAGADAQGMPRWEEKYKAERRVLSQSYRVPQKVFDVAQAIILNVQNRVPKEYAPRLEGDEPAPGHLEHFPHMDYLRVDPQRDSMLLYNDRFVRAEAESIVKDSGWAYRALNGMPAPLDTKAGQAMRAAELNTVASIDENDELRNCVRRGLNTYGVSVLENVGIGEVVQRLRARDFSIMPVHPRNQDFLRTVDLAAPQNLRLSTFYGAKGLEADDVHLILSLSPAAWGSASVDPDSLHRLIYTAVTRAKERLFVYDGENGYELPAVSQPSTGDSHE